MSSKIMRTIMMTRSLKIIFALAIMYAVVQMLVMHFYEQTPKSTPGEAPVVKQLAWVEAADPVADAKVAIEKNTPIFLGVRGYVLSVPGVPESKWPEYIKQHRVKAIEGTSDEIRGPEHMRLMGMATNYARQYNLYLLAHSTTQ